MNKIDILLLVILGFGLVRGFMRGLIIEMASLLAIVVGIYGAIHFSFFTARLLGELMPSSQQTIEVVAFGITLIVLMLSVPECMLMYFNLSICRFVDLSICQFVNLSICQFVDLSICRFVRIL